MEASYVSLPDLIIAYRKAKVDAFYETGHNTRYAFAVYEENLIENLTFLRDKINSEDIEFFTDESFIGEHVFTIKKINSADKKSEHSKESALLYFSNPRQCWEELKEVDIEYRVVGKHSVDFHILSSLWIEKVGYVLDDYISPNSYGCRLKISSKLFDNDVKSPSQVNTKNHLGHFNSYLSGYQKWQYNGLESIRSALSQNKKVLAVTADLRKYYHRIDCSFITESQFLKEIGLKSYSPIQEKLNRLLIKAISAWSKNVYYDHKVPVGFKFKGHSGIPMGLSASKVIANLLLISLDRDIENEIKPIYYGRYVDDFFIVIENTGSITNQTSFRNFLKARLKKLKKYTNPRNTNKSKNQKIAEYTPTDICYHQSISTKSLLEFANDKEKYFFLEGISGETFLSTLKESLDENSSEWNLPPNTESDIENFSEEVASASSDHHELANSLRKSDGVSIQRMKFILYLKRFETATTFLPKDIWEKPLQKFFALALEHTITPNSLSVYLKYFPRVMGLAAKTESFEVIGKLKDAISYAFSKLRDISSGSKSTLNNAEMFLDDMLFEGITFAINPFKLFSTEVVIFENFGEGVDYSLSVAKERALKLFLTDQHQIPFKESFITPDLNFKEELKKHCVNNFEETKSDLNPEALPYYDVFKEFSNKIWRENYSHEDSEVFRPLALYYYTRPFYLAELCILFPNWFNILDIFKKYCKLFHIEWFNPDLRQIEELEGNENIKTIRIKSVNEKQNRLFAFTSLETKNDSWIAVVREDGIEPDITRKQRILDLVADIIRVKEKDCKIDYVLFPELSIPRNLLLYISSLLIRKNISLITGAEYEIRNFPHHDFSATIRKVVSNQLHFILAVPGINHTQHVVLIQEKVTPAQKEERDLFDVGGAIMQARKKYKYLIRHGNFWFAGLICNDFLDINNRAIFRGLVDALIVIEWNKDIETYNALVESSANDLHAFILQVNNRLYGDTRLRAPYKEPYMRDVVRVRGGELDYFVVATLKVDELREFQRFHRSPEKPFKPVPTGYTISKERRKKG